VVAIITPIQAYERDPPPKINPAPVPLRPLVAATGLVLPSAELRQIALDRRGEY
jgi:hypothetical protein